MESTMKKTKIWSKPEIKTEMKIRETLASQGEVGPDANSKKGMAIS